ncbi:galactose-1-phosphate uridylyltransferase [Candidatus Hodarchaeum mangrovi]
MAEIRFDPFSQDYIIVNDKRLKRPIIAEKEDDCPFCANSKKRHPGLPLQYSAISIENLYPALSMDNPSEKHPFDVRTLYSKTNAIGRCEVILYSDDHELLFYNQPQSLTMSIIELWIQRYTELSQLKKIKYIFIFENRGSHIGVTIHHPHGQLYALSIIPPKIIRELELTGKYFKSTQKCLQCDIINEEKRENKRIISENEHFIAFCPFYSKWLYEVHLVPKRHVTNLSDLLMIEKEALAIILQHVRKKFDKLFNRPANFMMMLYPSPVNAKDYSFHHFRIEIVSTERDGIKQKYRAGVETGLNIWTNDISPEQACEIFNKIPD